jgi:hypothetical protein
MLEGFLMKKTGPRPPLTRMLLLWGEGAIPCIPTAVATCLWFSGKLNLKVLCSSFHSLQLSDFVDHLSKLFAVN